MEEERKHNLDNDDGKKKCNGYFAISFNCLKKSVKTKLKTPWPLVRKRTIPTERPPHVGEISANFG
jgi:hypothetical protein